MSNDVAELITKMAQDITCSERKAMKDRSTIRLSLQYEDSHDEMDEVVATVFWQDDKTIGVQTVCERCDHHVYNFKYDDVSENLVVLFPSFKQVLAFADATDICAIHADNIMASASFSRNMDASKLDRHYDQFNEFVDSCLQFIRLTLLCQDADNHVL